MMRYRFLFPLLIFLLWLPHAVTGQEFKMPLPSAAQNNLSQNLNSCGTDLFLTTSRKKTAFALAEQRMNTAILRYHQRADTDIITLPVVFHIVDGNPGFFSDAQVASAIADLNDAFGKTGVYSASAGADTKIRFCLAKKDPDGGITTGITRTVSFFSNDLNPLIEDAKLKNLVQWDPSHYINIWYIRSMHLEIMALLQCGQWLRMYAGGYATMPPGGGPTDGIVVTGLGDMLAHEMGHYLGLYHTFEGLDCRNYDCNLDGDRVCDTPPDASVKNSASCTSPENSCATDTLSGFTINVPDQIANFMDYGNASCHNEFTQGQADRMRAAIAIQRSGLLMDECNPPCTDAILASFTRDNPYPLSNDVINFTNTSSGAANYEWYVNGTLSNTSANFSNSFAVAGKYKVMLKAFNNPGCYSAFAHDVIVNCGVTARFYTDKRQIASIAPKYLDSIRFTNTSVNGATCQWLMANDKGMTEQVISTSTNLTYVFATPTNYTVRLVATNGACSDTTGFYPIPVIDPTPDGILYLSSVECYQQTKLRVSYFVCNYGYGGISKNIPVSFYDGDPRLAAPQKLSTIFFPDSVPGLCCGFLRTVIIDVGYRGLNTLYAVFNDSGNTRPLLLPNTTFVEKNYANNISAFTNFAFKVSATPPLSVLEWGDTLQLAAIGRPGIVSSYVWSSPVNLSCTLCQQPLFVADTTTTKQVVATSNYGCTDTARVVIQVPPYNDFSVEITDVQCARQDSLAVQFTIRNSFKRPSIPKGLTVAFYNADPQLAGTVLLPKLFSVPNTISAANASYTTVIKGMGSGTLYAVVNDSGKTVPVVFPATAFLEKSYTNNVSSFAYVKYTVTPTPVTAVLEWGDTLQLAAQGAPGITSSYAWSKAYNLSCAGCQSPQLIADTTTVKKVIATSALGCTDTAFVNIQVPPYNDFTVTQNDVQCAKGDSLYVAFMLKNSFKRGVLPKTLSVTFYNGDPATGGAVKLSPVFSLPDTVFAKQATFNTFIKGMPAGTLYAVVNDSGKAVPVVFPATLLLEKDYTNNITPYAYKPEELVVMPADTTVMRKQPVLLNLVTTVYNPSSTLWSTGSGYSLSCTACASPTVVPHWSITVPVQTENRFGCLLKGEAVVKIFPPDMTVKILETKCFKNGRAQLAFTLCMNNAYDSLWQDIPVSFYGGNPASGGRLLPPVFRTPQGVAGNCYTYTTIIAEPTTANIIAVVNDKGDNSVIVPNKAVDETDYANNFDTAAYVHFTVMVDPVDTSINRLTSIQLLPTVSGGPVKTYLWTPASYLSCADCPTPIATPPHTTSFQIRVQNELNCTATAMAIIRTHTQEGVYIPSAFTPNGDGRNDVLYVLSGAEVTQLKTFSIFNRWGQVMFSVNNVPANSPAYGWDGRLAGKEAPPAVYVYYVTVPTKGGGEKTYKGTVMLVR